VTICPTAYAIPAAHGVAEGHEEDGDAVIPLDGAPLDATPPDVAPLEGAPLDVDPPDVDPLEVVPVDVAPLEVVPLDVDPLDAVAPPLSADDAQAPIAPSSGTRMERAVFAFITP
jgi:hypothetical protein